MAGSDIYGIKLAPVQGMYEMFADSIVFANRLPKTQPIWPLLYSELKAIMINLKPPSQAPRKRPPQFAVKKISVLPTFTANG